MTQFVSTVKQLETISKGRNAVRHLCHKKLFKLFGNDRINQKLYPPVK